MVLQRLGSVIHTTPSHLAVLKIKGNIPAYNSRVFDSRAIKVGVVVNVFGPVKSPYVSFLIEKGMTVQREDIIFVEKTQKRKLRRHRVRKSKANRSRSSEEGRKTT